MFHKLRKTFFPFHFWQSWKNSVRSEEVLLELIKSKCMPITLCGSECLFLLKSDIKS